MDTLMESSADLKTKFTAFKDLCTAVINDGDVLMRWEWDDRFDTVLAIVSGDNIPGAQSILEAHFPVVWEDQTFDDATGPAIAVAVRLGGLRHGQKLFTSDQELNMMVYGAWWPWGGGDTVSIRIGVSMNGIPAEDRALLQEEFRGWFGC